MTDKTPAQFADDAAEAIRALNHATLNPSAGYEDWQYPGDAYSVVGGLDTMARRLPQALEQVRALLQELRTGGHLCTDRGGDGLPEVMGAQAGLRSAADHALAMQEDLADVHSALSKLAYKE